MKCTASLGTLLASWPSASEQHAAPAPPGRLPNVLFIMTDQQRYDCVGANGNPLIKTPNLDRLAAQSANFSHCFVQAPVCVPSRASFFTGRYAHAHRNRVNYTPLDAREVLFPALLQEAGFRTAIVGKTHLYYQYPPTADEVRRTGFEIVEVHDGVPRTDPWSDYAKWRQVHDPLHHIHYRQTARQAGLPDAVGGNPYRAAIAEQYSDTTWTGVRTCHWLNALADSARPFFLFSSFWKPHSPFEISAPFDSMYNDVEIPLPRQVSRDEIGHLPLPLQKLILRGNNPPHAMDREQLQWCYRSYYGAVSHIDREVGRILDTLDATGQAEHTIVVFASDHGDQMLEHGLMGKNVFYEASVRVPFMIRFPGRIKPHRHDELIESIDLLPTLFGFLGLPEPYHCHGRSLVPLICGDRAHYAARDAVFSENIIPEVITSGSHDFEFRKGEGVKGIRHPDAKMIRTRRWKYNHYPDGYAELYDLADDPGEEHNLADDPQHRETVNEMRHRLLDWLSTTTETEQIAPKWVLE